MGSSWPPADETARDAMQIAAAVMGDAPLADQPVTVTVRSGGRTVLRVRGVITLDRVGWVA